jgi:hypothetical protein
VERDCREAVVIEGDIGTMHAAGMSSRWLVILALAVVSAIVGGVFASLRWLAAELKRQIDIRLDRIEAVEQVRADELRRLERDIHSLRSELPMHYVRREDHIRDITSFSVKLDRIYTVLLRQKDG